MRTPLLDPAIPEKYRDAFETRRQNFGTAVNFYAPNLKPYHTSEFKNSEEEKFVSVSVTGGGCELECDHCNKKILESMESAAGPENLVETGRRLKENGARGLLVSGGSTSEGVVPLHPYTDALKTLKEELGLKVLVHTGVVDEELADGLAEAGVDAAMLDVIGHDDTIDQVYHLDEVSTEDFDASMARLSERGVDLAPHVVIGLHYGEILGESHALEMIAKHDPETLVLVVLAPQEDTAMADVEPPTPAEVGEVFREAREMFPETVITLGCKRPAGEHKLETDSYALKAGLNGIAYPGEGVVGLSGEMGLEPQYSELCCSYNIV